MTSANTQETRLATRLSFLAAGFAIACWAPLVPFAKQRLGVNDGELGLLLLCLGMGSVAAMLATGIVSARFGSKPVIITGGLGMALLLAVAMTIGRLCGDYVTARVGDRNTLIWGGLFAIAGFVVLLLVPVASLAMTGFLMIGFGASNLVPVLFRQAGAQRIMPAALAVAAITTVGYAGILLGPAVVGFVAKGVGLPSAFGTLAVLLVAVPVCAHRVTLAIRSE